MDAALNDLKLSSANQSVPSEHLAIIDWHFHDGWVPFDAEHFDLILPARSGALPLGNSGFVFLLAVLIVNIWIHLAYQLLADLEICHDEFDLKIRMCDWV